VIFRRVLSGTGWGHTLVSAAEGYELYGLEAGLPAAQWNYAANPAGDGYNNLMKYLHGLNPAKFAGTDPREGHLPHVVKNSEGGMDLVFTVDLVALEQLRDTWDRVELRMITSTDMTSWQWGLPMSLYAGSGEENVRFKEFRFPLPAGAGRMFVKMDINVVHEHDL